MEAPEEFNVQSDNNDDGDNNGKENNNNKTEEGESSVMGIVIGSSVIIVIVVLIAFLGLRYKKKKGAEQYPQKPYNSDEYGTQNSLPGQKQRPQEPPPPPKQ